MGIKSKFAIAGAVAALAIGGVVLGASKMDRGLHIEQEVVATIRSCYDDFTADKLSATTNRYVDGTRGNYTYNTAKHSSGAIQMRGSSNSGIVAITSPGILDHIDIVWNTATTGDRQIDVYGKNEEYTSTSNLYSDDSKIQGTLIGSLVFGAKETTLVATDDYAFIGLRSKTGALYVTSFNIFYR